MKSFVAAFQKRLFLTVGIVFFTLCRADGRSLRVDQHRRKLSAACRKSGYSFTPEVRDAYLNYARVAANDELKQRGRAVSRNFLKWVDRNPVMRATVYGAHSKPADVLAHFFSLGMDVGKDNLERYEQLLLAAAVVAAKRGLVADVTLRRPLKLSVSGDPRIPVDTKDRQRALDMNDHIINFLNDNTIEAYVVAGGKEELPELKYDDRGVAIQPEVDALASTGKEPRKRALYAADVIASAELQRKFNAYMKSKGFDVEIDCGDRIIHWNAREMVHGEMNKKIDAAYQLFKSAYEAKGLLPKERDPAPSMAERCAYLIRNHAHKFTDVENENRKWPRFPLNAPWPVLTMLVADTQPLRENEERWIAFRDEGVFKTYGEYIGSVAQQYNMQSARRISPYPFTYGSIQMMLKDGGVCGTMGNISARSHNTLGIPACTAGQPGHCAMVAFHYDSKQKFYFCKGGQYATGGDQETHPHTSWFFGNEISRKPMIYHQSIAFGVNYDLSGFLDSLIVYNLFHLLSESERESYGIKLLESGVERNPYSFLLVETLWGMLATPQRHVQFYNQLEALLSAAKNKPGCPAEGLYNEIVKKAMYSRINQLPLPTNNIEVSKVLAFLEKELCDFPAVLAKYRVKMHGLQVVLSSTERQFQKHVDAMRAKASPDNDGDGKKMADTLKAVSDCITNPKKRENWAEKLLLSAKGREKYLEKNYRLSTDPAIATLAEISGATLPPERERVAHALKSVSEELSAMVSKRRTLKTSKQMAAKIQAVANSLKDARLKSEWVASLAEIMKDNEDFKRRGRVVRDPCADVVDRLLEKAQ